MVLNDQPRNTRRPRVLDRDSLTEGGNARLVGAHEPAGGGGFDFLDGMVGDADGGVDTEGAGECLEGRDIWNARLGDEVSVHEDVAWACQVFCEAEFVVGRWEKGSAYLRLVGMRSCS